VDNLRLKVAACRRTINSMLR